VVAVLVAAGWLQATTSRTLSITARRMTVER
jgi:hypothetical protein